MDEKQESIIKNGYDNKEKKEPKTKYIDCIIHGHTKSTIKKGECDKCYRHRKYLERKNKAKNMKYCLFHGLQNFGKENKCPLCEKYKSV